MSYTVGRYQMEVTATGIQQKPGKNPAIVVTGNIDARLNQETGTWEGCEVWPRTIFMTVTAKSAEYVARKVRYAGFEGEDITEWDPVGTHIEVVCENDDSIGAKYPTRFDLPMGGGGSGYDIPHNEEAALVVSNLMAASLASTPKQVSAPTAAAPAAPDSEEDDSIPF